VAAARAAPPRRAGAERAQPARHDRGRPPRGGQADEVGDILEGVTSSGYRSGSANFRGIINQTLIKDKRFGQVERGVYELKSGGGGGESKKKGKAAAAAAAE
jgi:hypothetical protein